MEVNPIAGIRDVDSAASSRDELEVQPPIALTRSARLGDDAYNGAREETERGLEEDSEAGDGVSDMDSDTASRVSFVA